MAHAHHSTGLYFKVFAALMGLTALTVAAAYMPLGSLAQT